MRLNKKEASTICTAIVKSLGNLCEERIYFYITQASKIDTK